MFVALIDAQMGVARNTERLVLPAFYLRSHVSDSYGLVRVMVPDPLVWNTQVCCLHTANIKLAGWLQCLKSAPSFLCCRHTTTIFDFKYFCLVFFHPSLISEDALHYMMTASGTVRSCSTACVVCDHIHHLAARR